MREPLQPAPPRQIIRNAAWLVAWDEVTQSHVYRRDLDLTIERDTIAAIGSAGPADNANAVEIDGRGFAVLPGFVDIHAHPSSEPMLKGLTDEVGSRQLYMSSLYEYLPLFDADPEGRRAATEVALCELMQSGVTTVCDLSAARVQNSASPETIRSCIIHLRCWNALAIRWRRGTPVPTWHRQLTRRQRRYSAAAARVNSLTASSTV
jgi:cytosine/adenosine deaminase-related metal-dependent hydrolase